MRESESTYCKHTIPQDWGSLHGRLWCYRGIFPSLSPYKSGRRQAIDDAFARCSASLGAWPAFIGRARARLHTLYAARGMAGYCTRMAFEGVLDESLFVYVSQK